MVGIFNLSVVKVKKSNKGTHFLSKVRVWRGTVSYSLEIEFLLGPFVAWWGEQRNLSISNCHVCNRLFQC